MSEESDVSVDTQPDNTAADDTGGFFVPDEYKEAGWTQNIKSYDDLWKMNANAQNLIGRKTIGVPSEDATDAEINEFYAKTRPADINDYGLDEDDSKDFAQLFYDNGLSKRQVGNLVAGIQKVFEDQQAELVSQEGFDAEMKSRFGDNAKQTAQSVANLIKREANDKDKAVLEALPNNAVGALYGVINKIMTRYAVKDTDTGVAGTGSVGKKEPDWAGYNAEAQKLSSRPHTMADLYELKDKFNIPHK
jgi:hypothetical protein